MMKHETELRFFISLVRNYHIPCRIITDDPETLRGLDIQLHEMLNPGVDCEAELRRVLKTCEPNKVYRLQDQLSARHLLLQLPEEDDSAYILVGPYITREVTQQDILGSIERYSFSEKIVSQIEKIYYDLPVISEESILLTAVNTLGSQIWDGIDSFSLQDVRDSVFMDLEPVAARPEQDEPEDAFLSMQMLEKRYATENELMRAVSHGQTHKAEMLMASFSASHFEARNANPLRNIKNYAIITNTLFRKAAEAGSVHPLHIDSLSSRFARQIEQAASEASVKKIINEMPRKYCLLVKNHSMKGYSLLVQKVLVRIDSDLTADLSLKAQADFLDVNPSYLSALFKKETCSTLTEYVNRKRVEHGIFLLNTTSMQIQAIAACCGIPDVNYFTKTFKKIVGKTPKEYRDHISPYPRERIMKAR